MPKERVEDRTRRVSFKLQGTSEDSSSLLLTKPLYSISLGTVLYSNLYIYRRMSVSLSVCL